MRIEVAPAASSPAAITQALVASAPGPAKRATLRRLIRGAENFKNAIIFCNRKRDVAILHKSLLNHGFRAGALHGDMDQRARMNSLDAFKTGEVDLIVCSDVAARGLDIPDVSHVFNFDVPIHSEDYVHRIGRTGRAGKSGTAFSIVTRADQKHVDGIEKLVARKIDWLDAATLDHLPADEDIAHDGAKAPPRRDRGVAADSAAPRLGRGRRTATHASEEHHAPERSRQPRRSPAIEPAQQRRPAFADAAEDQPVIGMGDHVPSFLLRPVRLKPAKVVEEQE